MQLQLFLATLVLLCIFPVSSQSALLKKIQQIFDKNKEPRPVVVDDFLTAEESALLLERYRPLLRDSLHFSSSVTQSRYRTSRSVRLPPLGDALVFEIEARAAELAQVPPHQIEDFQLACYGVDELYGLHRDDSEKGPGADRAATVLIYLQSPDSGGATLFTRQELEIEVDLDTKRPLNTEAGALKLFRHYCDHPKRKFVVVEPQVGRAVTWPNWYRDRKNHTQFCQKSTHGACPVLGGEKCVIQQWIRRSKPQPLRDPRLVALFPLNVDSSFLEKLTTATNSTTTTTTAADDQSSICFHDASTNRGSWVQSVCPMGAHERQEAGPFEHLGSVQVRRGLQAALPTSLIESGATISFWGRFGSVPSGGMTLLSLGDQSATIGTSSNNQMLLAWTQQEADKSVAFPSYYAHDWLWFSLVVTNSQLTLSVYSKQAELLVTLSTTTSMNESCLDGSVESIDLKLLVPSAAVPQPQQPPNPAADIDSRDTKMAFVSTEVPPTSQQQQLIQGADISFLIFHKVALSQDEVVKLRHEAKRFDINM